MFNILAFALPLSLGTWWRDTNAIACHTAQWMWSVTSARVPEKHGLFKFQTRVQVTLDSFSDASHDICLEGCLVEPDKDSSIGTL
jgi:hypothetical protein